MTKTMIVTKECEALVAQGWTEEKIKREFVFVSHNALDEWSASRRTASQIKRYCEAHGITSKVQGPVDAETGTPMVTEKQLAYISKLEGRIERYDDPAATPILMEGFPNAREMTRREASKYIDLLKGQAQATYWDC